MSSLSPLDSLPRGVALVAPITFVSCFVEDGGAYIARSWQQAQNVHSELQRMLLTVVRQVKRVCCSLSSSETGEEGMLLTVLTHLREVKRACCSLS